jgi:hypothetical protein
MLLESLRVRAERLRCQRPDRPGSESVGAGLEQTDQETTRSQQGDLLERLDAWEVDLGV